jgi:hypothetical protein
MKALFAIFAVAAGLALAGSTPAAAKPVSKSDLRCLVLDGGNYSRRVVNVCTCTTVANVPQDIRALLKPDASRVSLHCPAGGGTAPRTADRTPPPPPDDHGHGWSFSKASSSSVFIGVAAGSGCGRGEVSITTNSVGGGCGGFAGILATQRNSSVTIGDGGGAAAGAGSGGGATNATFGGSNFSSTGGSTGGSSCAGSACGGGGGGGGGGGPSM